MSGKEGLLVVRRGNRLLGVCISWINDSMPFWVFLCLHLGTLVGHGV